jgi:hypothetical protein
MSIVIDGVIQDWDARLFKEPVKRRKPRNIKGGEIRASASHADQPSVKRLSPRDRLKLTTAKVPEVMVKITGGGKNMARIKAHFDYISRNGEVELEDEIGARFIGKEDVRDARDAWAMGRGGIPNEGERRREAFNIILSMPPGTNRQAVTDAARQFALEAFNDHQYVFATHTDEEHPHVHLCVKAVSKEGVRLNPRKADLHCWREHFADKLRDQGIAANATARRARGVVRKAEKQAVRWIDKKYLEGKRREPSYMWGRRKDHIDGVFNPAIRRVQKDTVHAYGQIARALAQSPDAEDKRLALKIVEFVSGFSSPKQAETIKTRPRSDKEK